MQFLHRLRYNFVADSIHTKKLDCNRHSSRMQTKNSRFAFLSRPRHVGGLMRGNVRCSSYRLIGKRVVDFLSVLIDLFFARCYGWCATSEYWLKIGVFALTGPIGPKFQVEGVAPPPLTILLVRKLGWMIL